MVLFLRICNALYMNVSLKLEEEPQTQVIFIEEKSVDEILNDLSQSKILKDLSRNAIAALYYRARISLEEDHAPSFTHILPAIEAKMEELLEADRR